MPGGGSIRRGAVVAGVIAAALSVPLLAMGAQQGAVSAGPRFDQKADWPLDTLDATWLWGVDQGAGVRVAIVDTGVQAGDRDLAGVTIIRGSGPGGGSGGAHGTRMAEIIAGQGVPGDQSAIVGLAPRAKLIDIPVATGQAPVTGDEIAAGIEAAVRAKARIINVSLGVAQQDPQLQTAVADAINNGCLVVADISAGGQAAQYPADSTMVLAVAGVGKDLRPDGSLAAHGPNAVYAPDAAGSGAPGNDVAVGYVSAAAALIWSAYPTLSANDLRRDLSADATGADVPGGVFGIVDPRAVLTALKRKPAASSAATGTPSPGSSPSPVATNSPDAHSSSGTTVSLPGPGFGGLDWGFPAAGAVALAGTAAIWRRALKRRTRPPGSPGEWQSGLWP
jgi:hypothetical protein